MEEKKKKGSWEPQSLRTAIDKVMSKELSVRQAAMQYNIPKSTIHDKIKALNRGEEVTMKPKLGKFTSTFSAEYEQVLVDHIKDLSNRCMPLMKKEFLKLAYDLAEVMKIPHRFNKEKGSADMTNIPLEQTETSSNPLNNEQAVVISNSIIEEQIKESEQSISEPITTSPKPSTSSAPDLVQIIHNLSPLPDAAKKRTAARKRKSERSEILTSSPYKKVVEEKENEKNMKDKKKEIKSKFEVAMRGKGKQTKGIKTKGKSVDKGKEATNVKPKGKKGSEVEPLTETSNTNITICVVCLEDTDEDWIQCSSCRGWIHEACADIPECGDDYICDRCRYCKSPGHNLEQCRKRIFNNQRFRNPHQTQNIKIPIQTMPNMNFITEEINDEIPNEDLNDEKGYDTVDILPKKRVRVSSLCRTGLHKPKIGTPKSKPIPLHGNQNTISPASLHHSPVSTVPVQQQQNVDLPKSSPGQPEIPPLPAAMIPAGGIPNENLLGHGPPEILHPEARQRIEGFEFPEGDSGAARLRVCPELMARINTVLFEMKNRYKMRGIGGHPLVSEIISFRRIFPDIYSTCVFQSKFLMAYV
ncbi:unnamed protein product [Danaus chrysippus]|uniref:(African queen) hypothetical protein n=1 Tax=Danaus chrysippus TaxID=151541 RepID=A0A8J2QNS4_9NEOP|nr:unnamed protein product [Danaus chrysippus]